MPDYGHPLRFGTFVTPVNARPEQPVALAQLSEQLGFDLVTFQDHPYQPAFLDTWTLLSWVAAQTERIHVAGNVLNLPLRPPAVLARASASLDLLSGGRFELGIGAGGFWDAIGAMGGRVLTPGQGVDALDEALDVIHAIWSDERGGARVNGDYYSLTGAKRGPLPAHDVPIWVGARKPRMLRLIGRKGDGWLPSLPYLEPGELGRSNAIIDEAAIEAGRDPGEVVRLLNVGGRFEERDGGLLVGPAEQWVEQLTQLALEDGVSTFIIMGDDPGPMQKFMAEVAPEVRERVAAERGPSSGAVRPRAAIALRREGIDYDAVPPELTDRAVEPGDFDYRRVRSTYMRGGSPGLVLRVRNVEELRSALAFARTQPVPLGIRSAGHGISGRSTNDGGIVIDLAALNEITVLDESKRLVRIGPGATWQQVAAALAPHGWALTSGDYGGVGVGGLATAGGIGFLAREHGLTIDHLRAAEVMLADGSLVRVSDDEHPELFWAVRGAGANIGVVTAFEFEVDEVGPVGWAQFAFDASDTAGFLERWGAAVEGSPRDLTSNLIMGGARPGQPRYAQVMTMVDSGDADVILERLQPIADAGPLVDQSVQLTTYQAVLSNATGAPHDAQGEPAARSGLVDHITPEFAAAIARLLDSGAVYFFQIRSVGGAVADIPADATAYAHRDANFSIAAIGSNPARLDEGWDTLRPLMDGLYLSFETDVSVARLEDAFPPATLERLRAIKREVDPDNVFHDNFNVLCEEHAAV